MDEDGLTQARGSIASPTHLLRQRLEGWRQRRLLAPTEPAAAAPSAVEAAAQVATALQAAVLSLPGGRLVVRTTAPEQLPLDRAALARLPGFPPPQAPLLCLDVETTGLGSAAGVFAFLVGLGWWEGGWFHRRQLLVADQGDEGALLDHLAATLPRDAWLVTYNGTGFDWPLLTTRFRLHRRPPPSLAGHLDLLPVARRLFRHRLPNARLRTVEALVLGLARSDDIEGWEVPSRFFAFLRGGPASLLAPVAQHNAADLRSLALLLRHLERTVARPEDWPRLAAGDLLALARFHRRHGRGAEALTCLDLALSVAPPWQAPRIEVERATLLARLGELEAALEAWEALARHGGLLGARAWLEVSLLRQRRAGDRAGALAAARRAQAVLDLRRALGEPPAPLEGRVARRLRYLQERWERERWEKERWKRERSDGARLDRKGSDRRRQIA
jgi:hypothetical protein